MMKVIKEMCSDGISFGRSKLLQSCSNLTLKFELEPTVIACLAGRDFVCWICPNTERCLRFLPDSFFLKNGKKVLLCTLMIIFEKIVST